MRGSVGGAGAGGRVDATQEMVTLGLCNMAGSLVHAMPTCGAFTRSAVSHSSGVRTPAAGAYSGATHTHTRTHTPVTHLTRLVTPTSLTRILDNPLEDETISNHFKHIRDFFLEGYLIRL